jgi:TPR repeat protein
MVQYGECCEEGFGMRRNYSEAFQYYTKASEGHDARGMVALSHLYFRGIGVPKNYKTAFAFAKAAAYSSFIGSGYDGVYLCGYCYYYGLGIEKDQNKGLQLLKIGAETGNPNSKILFNRLSKGRSNHPFERSETLKRSKIGYPGAMQEFAIFCCFGFGGHQSFFAAAKWFKKSRKEEKGLFNKTIENCMNEPDIPTDKLHFGSEMVEALELEFGVDRQIDLEKSASLFRSAAEGGVTAAMAYFGVLCKSNQRGTNYDLGQCLYWISKSAEMGNVDGIREFGVLMEFGEGMAVDYTLAADWYWFGYECRDSKSYENWLRWFLRCGALWYTVKATTPFRQNIESYDYVTEHRIEEPKVHIYTCALFGPWNMI